MNRWTPALAHLLAVLGGLLLACGALPGAAYPLPADDVRAALSAWTEAGYPVGRCGGYVERVRVVVVKDTRNLCRQENAGACLLVSDVGLFGAGGDYFLIVVRDDVAVYAYWQAIAHELVHAFARCAGLGWRFHAHHPAFYRVRDRIHDALDPP